MNAAVLPTGAVDVIVVGSGAAGSLIGWTFSKSAEIVYVGGYTMPGEVAQPTLPPALQAACVELVSSYWFARGRDSLVRQETVDGAGSTTYWIGAVGESGSLPPSVESKIAPYKRMVIC